MHRPTQKAHYGNVTILRGYCSECKGYAFVIDGKLRCCDKRFSEAPTKDKRMSDCPIGRVGPSRSWQIRIMREQDGRCFYCDRSIGSTVYRHSKARILRLHWDHVNPYVFSLDNREQNFVAACHVCNGIKSSFIFGSVDEARTYITSKWYDKGYSDLPPVRIELRAETQHAKVL